MATLKIKNKAGCIPVEAMRVLFENMVRNTPAFASNTPLGTVTINGAFSHYADPETDTMWLGFACGMRCQERLNNTVAVATN